jgi:hypothetical protein
MSVLFIRPDESAMIDAFRPRIMSESKTTVQVDNPDEKPGGWVEPHGNTLPDPAVGGQAASAGSRIGWSDGFIGIRLRRIGFTGKIWTAPDVKAEPVQGVVGQSVHANRLWGGVRQQETEYDGSLSGNLKSYVGRIS